MNTLLTRRSKVGQAEPWLVRLSLGTVGVLLLCLLLAGCQFLDLPQATPSESSTATPPESGGTEATATVPPVPGQTDAPTPTAPSVITLTLWTTEAFSPTEVLTSGQVLADQLGSFLRQEPAVRLETVLRKPYGRGGILDFLLNTEKVVPELLPDLVVLDTQELGSAVSAGLLQPLDDLLTADLIEDMFPFAQQACSVESRLYCVQLYANIEHLVYDAGLVAVPPRSWVTTLSEPGPYLFPAGGTGGLVNDAFWIQYLALPQPEPRDGIVPLLDAERLARVLQFYADGVERGIIPEDVLEYNTPDDCWSVYLNGEAAMTNGTLHGYLADRALVQNSGFAPIPTGTGRAMTLSRGWGMALVAQPGVGQESAVALIEWLSRAASQAQWTYAARYGPTRRAALAFWGEDTAYRSFLEQQLAVARPRPLIPDYTRVATALQQAVERVIRGQSTPQAAANEVLRALQSP